MTIRRFAAVAAFHTLMILLSCSPAKKVSVPPAASPGYPPTDAPAVPVEAKEDEFMVSLFKTQPALFDNILSNRTALNVQVIYTQIDRNKEGEAKLTTYYFNRKNARYFYPASTVKFPVALLALQKMKELNIPGLDRNSTMITDVGFSGQVATFNDPNTADGRPSIAQYIKQIFLVSDNEAFNRLYEMLGQEYINAQLHRKGYNHTEILHRLNVFLSETENRTSNPVRFFDSSKKLLYHIPMQVNHRQYEKRNDLLGTGYYSGGKLVNQAMDFSRKNRLPLEDLHRMMQGLIFPGSVKPSERFDLSEEDRQFVLQYMSEYPGESRYPYYGPATFTDAYAKVILFGNDKGKIPPQIRSFSKSGTAYGQLTETAYIIDTQKNIEFLVTATIDCNSDGIYNDDQYDYTGIGYPFMKNLGKLLYNYESNRIRKHQPDLSTMKFSYDK